jgi:hypothetical protein
LRSDAFMRLTVFFVAHILRLRLECPALHFQSRVGSHPHRLRRGECPPSPCHSPYCRKGVPCQEQRQIIPLTKNSALSLQLPPRPHYRLFRQKNQGGLNCEKGGAV